MSGIDPTELARNAFVRMSRAVRPVINKANGDWQPDITNRTRHWLTSMGSAHDAAGLVYLDVPWWTYRAIESVDTFLNARTTPARVLEYGSGASTVWLAKRSGSVDSIEHHRGFSELVVDLCKPFDNVNLHVVEPVETTTPKVPSGRSEFVNLDFADYVQTGRDIGGLFDLIVIDGRAREACLEAVMDQIAPDGVVVFDNSNRERYRSTIENSGLVERRLKGLAPTLPYPDQTSLLFKRHLTQPNPG